ncbi:BUD13-like protein [Labeo rohita]|uniref:BUD13 homolog n=1 Tax=Labeo rohita TaxID=84645 RepID=A0A498MYB5_LABRO|nr:BUD13-like protein [Labeo rohita]
MTRRTLLLYEECGTIPLTSHPRGLDATHQISHPKEEVVMTHQIFHLRDKELRTKTDGMIPHHLPLQERATKAHPLELNGHMIKSLHTEKRQKLLLQMIFRHLGDEYEQAKAQTLISPHRADVLINDGAAQIQICLHLEREAPRMLSGGAAGLVSVDILRKEQEEIRKREKRNQPLEEASRNAQTIFRDKSGKQRDLKSEREELSQKAGEKAEKDEKYAQWGKGLVQEEMQQQNVIDAMREAQKPLARHIDDEDLDRMLREQEREGDPMAAMLRKKKDKNAKLQGIKEKPRYKGPPPPPNRFNIMPGYRWDGVDRSNGFEQKRYSRISDKKAVQEMAYKWSVEDM